QTEGVPVEACVGGEHDVQRGETADQAGVGSTTTDVGEATKNVHVHRAGFHERPAPQEHGEGQYARCCFLHAVASQEQETNRRGELRGSLPPPGRMDRKIVPATGAPRSPRDHAKWADGGTPSTPAIYE